MALTAVLVDQARVLEMVPAARRIEGSRKLKEQTGPWFRARLFLAAAPQDVAGQPRTVASPQLMYGVKDRDGGLVALNANQRVEVESAELGNARWEVTGDPEPMRKRRRVIGYQVPLTRVEEHETTL